MFNLRPGLYSRKYGTLFMCINLYVFVVSFFLFVMSNQAYSQVLLKPMLYISGNIDFEHTIIDRTEQRLWTNHSALNLEIKHSLCDVVFFSKVACFSHNSAIHANRYPLLLDQQNQHGIRSLSDASTCYWRQESNPRPFDSSLSPYPLCHVLPSMINDDSHNR